MAYWEEEGTDTENLTASIKEKGNDETPEPDKTKETETSRTTTGAPDKKKSGT